MQIVPAIAEEVALLTVYQRSANWCTPLNNRPITTDEQAQLPYWEIRDAGMSLRLVQRLPDQTRGFFTARGFSAEHAERIELCIFDDSEKRELQQNLPAVRPDNVS